MANLGRNSSIKAYFVRDDDGILVEYKIKIFLPKPLRYIRGGRAEFKVKLLSLLTSAIDGVVSFTLRLLYHQ